MMQKYFVAKTVNAVMDDQKADHGYLSFDLWPQCLFSYTLVLIGEFRTLQDPARQWKVLYDADSNIWELLTYLNSTCTKFTPLALDNIIT